MEPETQKDVEKAEENVSEASITDTNSESNSGIVDDNSKYRTLAIVGYILPFLFFLPLLNDESKNVQYVRFHANQQLILLILILGLHFLVSNFLIMLGSVVYMIMDVIKFSIVVLALYGAWNTYQGGMKELPFVGKFKILK